MQRMKTRSQEASRITMAGLVLNVVLTLLKYLTGFVGNSSAMIADATHSLSDLVTDVVVLLGFRVVGKPADKDHQYGHGKIETLLASICGLFLLMAGFGILFCGASEIVGLIRGEDIQRPGIIAFTAALISLISKELLFRYTRAGAERLNSPALVAKAWDHRSDALSSLGVLAGIGGAIFLGEKWVILDPLAALLVSLFIIRIALSIIGESLNELLEASLDKDMVDRIFQTIRSVEEVRDIHLFRTRKIGPYFAVESHIMVDRELSLVDAHKISNRIENLIHEIFGDETLVTLHVEPLPGKNSEHREY